MKKPHELEITESLSELKKFRANQPTLLKQKRIDCLLHLKTSKFKTRQELANHLGIHIRTQERWLTKYREGGLSSLLTDLPNNRPSKIITKEIHNALKSRVNSSDAPFLGYWEAQQWLNEEFGVEIKYHWLRKYLKTHFKTKLKSPRKSHYKKDEQAIEAFFKTAKDVQRP
jgi:transposase